MVGFAASFPSAIEDAELWPMNPAVFNESLAIGIWGPSGGGMSSPLEDSGVALGVVGRHPLKVMVGAL